MKRSKSLGALLFYQQFINKIGEENQQISKTSHIDHSTFPCFLNPEMVQGSKIRQERKEPVLWAEDLSSFLPTGALFVLGQVNLSFDSSAVGQRLSHTTEPNQVRESDHELHIC